MITAFSFGGGVQSTAVLVLASQGKLPYQTFLFANTGDDSENPATLSYIRDHSGPFAAANNLTVHELRWVKRSGLSPTLYEALIDKDNGDIPIPAWMAGGAPGNRKCTQRWKIDVVARWLRKEGATKNDQALLGLGISLDEIQRMRSSSGFPHYNTEYPLVNMRLKRSDCLRIIAEAGLPEPPKSACWFCPFKSYHAWQEMKFEDPAQFERAVSLEKSINLKRESLGRDHVFLSGKRKPLEIAIRSERQANMFEDSCDSGYCTT